MAPPGTEEPASAAVAASRADEVTEEARQLWADIEAAEAARAG
jgi:hypothetical protein